MLEEWSAAPGGFDMSVFTMTHSRTGIRGPLQVGVSVLPAQKLRFLTKDDYYYSSLIGSESEISLYL